MGMSQLDPSIGVLLKNLGYATGQFGKNHVGDRNPSLPTVNGFDEFFGNLYHLNAEEEPELPDYPKDPAYLAKFGPRGVLRCKATDIDDPTVDPRFGKVGKQTVEDTGPLTKKRMETIDDETSAAAIDYMKRQQAAGKPFFVWFNGTRMHLRTHVRAEHRGRYNHGDSEYIDGRGSEDEGAGFEHMRQRAGVVLCIGRNLRERDVARRLDELAELAVGDGSGVHPEPIDSHPMDRCFLGVMLIRAHGERAAGEPDHVDLRVLRKERHER
jgi:hypothetical protein